MIKKEKARVEEIKDEKLRVLIIPLNKNECQGCTACQRGKPCHAWLPCPPDFTVHVGDWVWIERRQPSTYLAVVLGMFLPALCFIAGAVGGYELARHVSILDYYRNLVSLGGGFLLAALAYLIAYSYDQHYRRHSGPHLRISGHVAS